MTTLWLLKGEYDAPGWRDLERESRAAEIDLVIFDRTGWALMYADEAPTKYEGLEPTEPADGLYVSEQGQPVCVAGRKEVAGPRLVIRALGAEAEELLAKMGDPIAVLQRLGRAF